MSITSEERYKYLIQARNYHYTQFNIWMAFFLAIISALFVAYCTLAKAADNDLFTEKILVLVFGYIVSFFFHLSSKGYYYWITNWIMLITEHERTSSYNPIYSCFANKKANNSYYSPIEGANISTSKIVCFLSYLFTFAFGILFLHNLEQYNNRLCTDFSQCNAIIKIILSIALIFTVNMILAYASKKFKSNTSNHKDLKI